MNMGPTSASMHVYLFAQGDAFWWVYRSTFMVHNGKHCKAIYTSLSSPDFGDICRTGLAFVSFTKHLQEKDNTSNTVG